MFREMKGFSQNKFVNYIGVWIKMYKIGICDDDSIFVEELFRVVKQYCDSAKFNVNILVYKTGQELLFRLQDNEYIDIFILDIEMPGISGLELASEIKKYHPDTIVIFVTSYVKYAPQSFELSVFRYIPKKFLLERIDKALEDAFNIIKLQKGNFYLIENSKKNVRLYYCDIVYIYKYSKNSIFELYSKTGRSTESVRKSLTQVFSELNSDDFVYIERGCIVNVGNITKIMNDKIYLVNGETLKVAEINLPNVKKHISKFWRKLM